MTPQRKRSSKPGRLRWAATAIFAGLLAAWLIGAWWVDVSWTTSLGRLSLRSGGLIIAYEVTPTLPPNMTVTTIVPWPTSAEHGIVARRLSSRGIQWTMGPPANWTMIVSGTVTTQASTITLTPGSMTMSGTTAKITTGTITVSPLTLSNAGTTPGPVTMTISSASFFIERFIPLWPAALIAGLASARSWRRHMRAVRPGWCPTCGYDRAGISASSVCPECGTQPEAR